MVKYTCKLCKMNCILMVDSSVILPMSCPLKLKVAQWREVREPQVGNQVMDVKGTDRK